MKQKTFIFLCGLHRSGTSLLHEILSDHPRISGFSATGAQKDEGQHLQSVFAPAKDFGGAGKFVFDNRSYMDESHPLATVENRQIILKQWGKYWDMTCNFLIEKSPPNLVRTRFLQKLFSRSKFIVLLRHPIAVSYATQKWSNTSLLSLLEHTLLAYMTFKNDMSFLKSVFILRYEDFVIDPQKHLDQIFSFLGVDSAKINREVYNDVNEKYYAMWESYNDNLFNRLFRAVPHEFEKNANTFGYSIVKWKDQIADVPWLKDSNTLRGR